MPYSWALRSVASRARCVAPTEAIVVALLALLATGPRRCTKIAPPRFPEVKQRHMQRSEAPAERHVVRREPSIEWKMAEIADRVLEQSVEMTLHLPKRLD